MPHFQRLTFVLGAGASVDYGFPLAGKLRDDIIESPPSIKDLDSQTPELERRSHFKQLAEFKQAFSSSHQPSIDAFLASQPQHADYGKFAIASRLMDHELDAVGRPVTTSGWFGWLFNVLYQQFDRVQNGSISFVSFNYDNLIQIGLYKGLRYSRGLTHEEAWRLSNELAIAHVYGNLQYDLNRVLSNSSEWDDYRLSNRIARAREMARGIRIISERENARNPELARAREFVLKADIVVVLGLSYDLTNLRRVGLNVQNPSGEKRGAVFATAYGLEHSESEVFKRRIGASRGVVLGERDAGCEVFLRRHCAEFLLNEDDQGAE